MCGSAGAVLHSDVCDELFGAAGSWAFRKCNNVECGLVWLDPQPLPSCIHLAYERYYTHGEVPDGSAAKHVVWRVLQLLTDRL